MQLSFVSGSFKQQSQQKPEGKEIQTDQTVDMIPALAVIPGAGVEQAKKTPGKIFHQKNKGSIDCSAQENTQFFQRPGNHGNQCSKAINGKHQQGSLSHQSFIIGSSQIVEAGEKNLHRPSDQTAAYEIGSEPFE